MPYASTSEQHPDDMLKPSEAAAILRVSVSTLEQWRGQRKGPPWAKLGTGRNSPIRYRRGDIDDFKKTREA